MANDEHLAILKKGVEGILEWLNEYRPNPNGPLYIKDNKLVIPGED